MGRRQHDSLETDILIARKDEQISNLDTQLDQTINHLSLVRARLLSTLDQLDALQHEHTATLAAAAREQQRLETKLRVAEETAREGEADRMDMRHAVEMLVKRVEATPDFRNWPRSQIQLSRLSEPSVLFSAHSPPHSPSKSKSKFSRNRHPAFHTSPPEESPLPDNHNRDHAALTEQLAYATTLISHFRVERDAALVHAERSEALVLELEARLARRDAELEGCVCATTARTATATRLLVSGRTPIWSERHTALASRRKPRDDNDPFEADADPDLDGMMSDILDVSVERNRELEKEVELLSRRLDHARAAQDPFAPAPLQNQHEGDASLLSSLSFSPPSTATSGAAGMATPRQHQYTSRPSAIYNNDYDHEYVEAGSFSTYEDEAEDEDESVTQPVGHDRGEAIHGSNHEHNYNHDPVYNPDPQAYDVLKSVAVPIPSLHALHRQIALLSEKIDAFAAERRRAAEASLDVRTGGAGHVQTERGDGHARGTRGVPATVSGGHREKSDRTPDEEDIGNSRNPDTREETHSEDAAGHVQRSPNGDSMPHYHKVHTEAAQEDDADGPYVRAAPPSPLPLPLSLPVPVPPPQTHHALSLSPPPPPPPRRDETGYDHPHETCEAALLAARKRETDLVARVRVLEGALSVVEAQLRQREEKDIEAVTRGGQVQGTPIGRWDGDLERGTVSGRCASAVQENGAEAWWRDVAVQTLNPSPPPQSPQATPAPVGDLLGFDVPDPHAVEEETTVREDDAREGEREDGQKDVDYGEMPMELATPLLSISAMPVVQDDDGDSNLECDSSADDDGWEGWGNVRRPASEAASSVEEDLDADRDPDAPASPHEVYLEEDSAARSPNLRHERGNLESFMDPPPGVSVCSAPSPPQTRPGTPSPLSSTGTSPTIAVGLLPPLLPHAHLSLPLPLHHSHHASSFSAPLLPLPHPHSALRRAHTDSDIGTNCHSHDAGSAQRFVLYRATSSFVAELRQVEAESQLAESAAQVEDQRALERDKDLVAPVVLDTDAGTEEGQHDSDSEHLPPAASS